MDGESISGESISARRCRRCVTDDVGEDRWIYAGARSGLQCGRCAAAALRGDLGVAGAAARYRGRGRAPRAAMRAAYRAVIAFKSGPDGARLGAPLGRALGEAVETVLAAHELRDGAWLVPVPSYGDARPHARRLVVEAAQHVRRVEPRLDLLEKRIDFRQTNLSRSERRAQSAEAFAVRWGSRLRDRTVIVADDVVTSGATINACAAALLRAGVGAVYAAEVVRTVPPPPARLVAWRGRQVIARFLEADATGCLHVGPLPPRAVVWVRFGCGPCCPSVLTAGPLALPAVGVDTDAVWSCDCGERHAIRLARCQAPDGNGVALRVDVPPRHPSELLLALRAVADREADGQIPSACRGR